MSGEHLEHGAQPTQSTPQLHTQCLQGLSLGPETCFVYVSSEVRAGAVMHNDGRTGGCGPQLRVWAKCTQCRGALALSRDSSV
jgi:hypothetical protein